MEPILMTKLQRFLRAAVACLLTANGFAVAALIGSDAVTHPGAAAAAARTRTITLVTTKTGARYLADPSTPEGRQAIENARRDGATVQEIASDAADSSPADHAGAGPALTLPNLDDLLHLPKLPIDLHDPVGSVKGVVDGVTSTASSVVDSLGGTASSLVDTATSVVDGLTGSTLPPVSVPPVTLPPVTAPPATLPPVTLPPVTLPPVTQPPATVPPTTTPVTLPVTVPTVPPVTLPHL
jgi:hypothetical protein